MGVAGSRMYTVNDSGSALAVYVLDQRCRVVRVIRGSIDPYDVEDLAVTADGTLWLADTGDNRRQRTTVAIELLSTTGAAAPRLYRFRYPDGAHDAEALLVDRQGRPFFVTKEPLGVSGVYTPVAEPAVGVVTALRKVATVQVSFTGTAGGPAGPASQLMITGGAVSPDGTEVALRTYTDAYLWHAPDGDVLRALRDSEPVRVPLPQSRQGEAIAFSADGATLLTSTEGLPAAVHAVPVPADARRGGATAAPGATVAAAPSGAGGPSPSPSAGGGSQGGDSLSALVLAGGLAAVLVWGAGWIRRATGRG